MVFFAFHHYLTTNFHLNIFFAGNYISVLFATSHGVSIYCFKHFTSYPCFYFLQIFMHYKKEATIFQIYSKKILHIKPSDKSSALLYKIFEEFNNDLYLGIIEVTTIEKGKIFCIT